MIRKFGFAAAIGLMALAGCGEGAEQEDSAVEAEEGEAEEEEGGLRGGEAERDD